MSIHEECGVFGILSPVKTSVAHTVYCGLYALQHRGQESCGIVTNDDGVFSSHKDLGLVSEVFNENTLAGLSEGEIAIGHVRYGTTGATTRLNTQPIEVNHQKGKMAIAHNGNLSNALALRDELELSGAIFHSTSDTETIAYIITRERLTSRSIEEAVSRSLCHFEGAYSLVIMSSKKLIAVRDPLGFRPLCYGRTKDGSVIFASESCALQACGAKMIRDLKPGEIMVAERVKTDGQSRPGSGENPAEYVCTVRSITDHCGKSPQYGCIFEYIYFARPDSEIDGVSVHAARVEAGRILAHTAPVDADLVVGVPDSGLDAALGYSQASGIPSEIGLIKNKYIGRTFIAPGQKERVNKVRLKLSPVRSVLNGKRIVLIDDSIVRGTTSCHLIEILREAGAKEIHLRISAPPFLHPCYYGTDIDSEKNLIATHHSVDEICRMIGADSLAYLPINELHTLCHSSTYCAACFNGKYPTAIPEDTRKDRFEQKLSERGD